MPSSTAIQNKLEIGDLSHMTTYHAGILQASANRALRLFCNEVLRPYGITKKQWMVIGLAIEAGLVGVQYSQLANRLDMTTQSLTAIVNTLQRRNKIIIKTTNGNKAITIHPDFQPDCQEIERIMRTALRASIYRQISPLEFRIYLKVLYFLSELKPNQI